ncbi:hypothetical protein H710_00173 [Bartonella bacilliformis Ver097]|uniref:Uncharacterized protein n=1 Tax=Bartonella bacilliformis Ver097 TaxID=1293911 RepID=A0A072R653_BARBA|nr:hypothetical protein H710_00173 [Bartonella bacilliformis Ver097]
MSVLLIFFIVFEVYLNDGEPVGLRNFSQLLQKPYRLRRFVMR